jgi:hypothetical protein
VAASGPAARLDHLDERAQPLVDVPAPFLGLRRRKPVLQRVVVIARGDFHDELLAALARQVHRFHRPAVKLAEQALGAAFAIVSQDSTPHAA